MKAVCVLLVFATLGVFVPGLVGQEDELVVIEAVAKLQKKLDSDDLQERDAAEKKLISMGVEILDYLRPIDEDATTDYRERLARIRKSLEKESVNSVSEASRVTISGTMSIGEALKKIRLQTQNEVEVQNDVIADKEISLEIKDADFWTAVQSVMTAGKLEIDRYGSEKPNQLMLAPISGDATPKPAPSCNAKIFRTQVTRVDSSINLSDERLDFTSINLLLRWEPRLRPISVDIPLSSVNIVDEYDDKIELTEPERVLYGMVQPEIPEVEFQLQVPRVDRQVENLKTIQAKIIALIPGRSEQFRFENLGKLEAGHKLTKAGAVVTYGGTRKNEDLYGVKVSLSFDEENNALESHQGWVFHNEVYLQDRQGNREEVLSMESFRQDNEMVTIQYYFLKEPGDRTLVYKTPATIVKMPVDIELKKIPMP